jgi:hypothetical protein
VTAPTVRKWLGRYPAGGAPALADASSRPACSPRSIAPATALLIVELRLQRQPEQLDRRLVVREVISRCPLTIGASFESLLQSSAKLHSNIFRYRQKMFDAPFSSLLSFPARNTVGRLKSINKSKARQITSILITSP